MPPASLPQLTPVSLDISKITCRCSVWRLPRRDKGESSRHGGLIAFRGVYTPGSGGGDDARFIHWRLGEFADIGTPALEGMVVDFRELDYTWGDDLAVEPSRMRLLDRPVRVVVRPEQVEAFRGTLGGRELRTDLRTAFAEVAEAVTGVGSEGD